MDYYLYILIAVGFILVIYDLTYPDPLPLATYELT